MKRLDSKSPPAGLTIDCWKLNLCTCGSELITTCLATLRAEKQARIRCHRMWGRMAALVCVPVYVGWKLIGVDHQTSSRVAISNSWCSKFRSFVASFHLGQTSAAHLQSIATCITSSLTRVMSVMFAYRLHISLQTLGIVR